MPVVPPILELISRKRDQPRSILGFLSGMVFMVFVLCSTTLAVLSGSVSGTALAILAVVLVGLVLGIAVWVIGRVLDQAKTDPSGLVLKGVSGSEYEQIQRLTLGSSEQGRREISAVGSVLDGIAVIDADSEPESPPNEGAHGPPIDTEGEQDA